MLQLQIASALTKQEDSQQTGLSKYSVFPTSLSTTVKAYRPEDPAGYLSFQAKTAQPFVPLIYY